MSEATDSINSVARELWRYANAWEPDVRLIGNVRAADIMRLCELVVEEFDPGDPCIGPQCTCYTPTRLGSCPVHEKDRR
jgi:hypothetical protein